MPKKMDPVKKSRIIDNFTSAINNNDVESIKKSFLAFLDWDFDYKTCDVSTKIGTMIDRDVDGKDVSRLSIEIIATNTTNKDDVKARQPKTYMYNYKEFMYVCCENNNIFLGCSEVIVGLSNGKYETVNGDVRYVREIIK